MQKHPVSCSIPRLRRLYSYLPQTLDRRLRRWGVLRTPGGFPTAPRDAPELPEAPSSSKRLPTAPGDPRKFQEPPRDSLELPDAAPSSQRLSEGPRSSQSSSEAAGGSQRLPVAPSVPRAPRRPLPPTIFSSRFGLLTTPGDSRRPPATPVATTCWQGTPNDFLESFRATGDSRRLPAAPGDSGNKYLLAGYPQRFSRRLPTTPVATTFWQGVPPTIFSSRFGLLMTPGDSRWLPANPVATTC